MARKKKEHKISFHIFDSSCTNHRRIITSNYEVTLTLIYKKILTDNSQQFEIITSVIKFTEYFSTPLKRDRSVFPINSPPTFFQKVGFKNSTYNFFIYIETIILRTFLKINFPQYNAHRSNHWSHD